MNFPFITTKHTTEVITLALAKQWLRMDIVGYTGEDSVIEAAIKSAVSRVENHCNLQLGVSTYTWNTECRPCDFADVHFVKSITSIEYHNGTSYTTVDTADYELLQTGERKSRIIWKEGVTYDAKRYRIVFTAGLSIVPEDLKRAMRAMIGEDFDNRGDGVSERKTLSDKLMADYRIGYPG